MRNKILAVGFLIATTIAAMPVVALALSATGHGDAAKRVGLACLGALGLGC